MRKSIEICMVVMVLVTANSLQADWQRSPASDADKEFISGDEGILPGVPGTDMTCWMAAASNMLAGAGYGNGATIQERTEDIYLDLLVWRVAIDPTNTHGARDGGWMDNALNWWLASANNIWTSNPFVVINVYGNTDCTPWNNANAPRFLGNQLRDYETVSLAIRWPSAGAGCNGGHAITLWGDDQTSANLTANPAELIVADSDRDNGGPFQTYVYDDFTNPNPGGSNEGNGWYFNFSENHALIVQAVTLSPVDSPVDPHDGPAQMVMGSYKINQDELQDATDLHYTAWTDYDILSYRTEIDWPTSNDPVITESNTHVPSLTRSDIHADWDLTDNPVPYGKDVTITTEFILQNWNGLWYDDVYFTYPGGEDTKYIQPPFVSSIGTDIRVDNYDNITRVLADDFPCTQTGEITKIYLWGSWIYDSAKNPPPGTVRKFTLSIYSDDPVGDDPKNPDDDPTNQDSKPLNLLWTGDFDQFTESVYDDTATGEEFWDPFTAAPLGEDSRIWQYEIDIPETQAFMQRGTRSNPLVYWLAVSAEIVGDGDVQFGWHTTEQRNGWNDKAVAWKDVFILTDEFDYSEDRTTHKYEEGGSVSQGTYRCDGANDDSLRIGNGDADAYASITVAVLPNTDKVKLRYRVPWTGFISSAPVGGTLYVDGANKGELVSDICNWQEKVLTGMSSDTADGYLEIRIIDRIDGNAGDTQITYMEVYSAEKGWSALTYPQGHELVGQSVNMAFAVVTPTSQPGLIKPRFGWDIVTAPAQNINIPDITGGYIIGSFDVLDESGASRLLGQYRFVHQYPYTQDPEHHVFTIQGPDDQAGCEYRATNFHFGHSYGRPDAESLWQFNDWMSSPVMSAYICNKEPLKMTLDWEGRLPYPESNITPAHKMPEIPECTVYLKADINKDCCVDFGDLAIVAEEWSQCTKLW